jgi:hypothetical protein
MDDRYVTFELVSFTSDDFGSMGSAPPAARRAARPAGPGELLHVELPVLEVGGEPALG